MGLKLLLYVTLLPVCVRSTFTPTRSTVADSSHPEPSSQSWSRNWGCIGTNRRICIHGLVSNRVTMPFCLYFNLSSQVLPRSRCSNWLELRYLGRRQSWSYDRTGPCGAWGSRLSRRLLCCCTHKLSREVPAEPTAYWERV